jgi:2-C-methyl-D-erythritol 4-phosphate cytidylyltransferase
MYAIIPAAGRSVRMGSSDGQSKLLSAITDSKTVLEYTVESLVKSGVIQGFVIATRNDDAEAIAKISKNIPNLILTSGGEDRQTSVYNAIIALGDRAEFVMIHDGARPLCPPAMIRAVAKSGQENGAALLAIPARSTLKVVIENGSRVVRETVPREMIWEAQTPQVFNLSLLKAAHEKAIKDGFKGTDDSMLVERMGHVVHVVEGSPLNIKITTKEDLINAQLIASSKPS